MSGDARFLLLGKGYWTPFEAAMPLGEALRSPAALLLTAGYAAGIVVALHTSLGGRLLGGVGPDIAVGWTSILSTRPTCLSNAQFSVSR